MELYVQAFSIKLPVVGIVTHVQKLTLIWFMLVRTRTVGSVLGKSGAPVIHLIRCAHFWTIQAIMYCL